MTRYSRGKPGFGQKTIFDGGEIEPIDFAEVPDPTRAYPTGRVYEKSGNASGRISDHSGPIPRVRLIGGMTEEERVLQHSINTAGADAVNEIVGAWSQPERPSVDPRFIDPETGRAILGAAAMEYRAPSEVSTDQLPIEPDPTWAEVYVAGLKANMQFPHSRHHGGVS